MICLDGTGNEASRPHTNVYRTFQVFKSNALTFYHPGVNTLVSPDAIYKQNKLVPWFQDSISGSTMRIAVDRAYNFLIENYAETDKIWFFGFSRGAYAVRMLAAIVAEAGILRREHASMTPYIWQAYIDAALRPGKGKSEKVFPYLNRIKRDFSGHAEPKIAFLGAWDTVSSFGSVTAFKSCPFTRNNPQIPIVRHAVALDERRGLFQVNLFGRKFEDQDLLQMWFPGFHSDVGGGQDLKESGLSMVSFDWMLAEAERFGIERDEAVYKRLLERCPPDPAGKAHNSMDALYSVLELLPIRKYSDEEKGLTWHSPNWFRPRSIPVEDSMHPSVDERKSSLPEYRPAAVRLQHSLPERP